MLALQQHVPNVEPIWQKEGFGLSAYPKEGRPFWPFHCGLGCYFAYFSLGIIHLNEYQYDLFHTKHLSKNVVWLDDPLSKNDLRIIITASGKKFLFINSDAPLAVDVEHLSIEIFNQSGTLAIASIDVGSKELTTPIDDYEKTELKQIWGSEEPDFNLDPATFLMDSLEKSLPTTAINDAMHDEVQQATEFALVFASRIQRLEEGQALSDEIYAGSANDLSKPFLFESLSSTDWENIVTDTPPSFIFLVFPAACFIAWIIGILVIRRALYARMASNGIPDENRMT